MRPVLAALLLVACGSSPPPVDDPPPRDDPQPGHDPDPPAQSPDLRALGAAATFEDLLRAARTLDDRRDQDSDDGCLIGRDAQGWRLAADLAVAVRPLANAPEDMDPRLSEAGPVVVLSRWGQYGEAREGALVFNAVTTTLPPRTEPAVVWVVTDAGVAVRSTRAEGTGPGDAAAARAALPEDVGALFVAAESTTALSRLAEVLAHVPDALHGRVGLAVLLADGVRLPDPPEATAGEDAAALCPDGLPPPPDGSPRGDLRPDRIVASLGPLRQGAEACAGATTGPGAAGARVALAMRIGPDGRLADVCVSEDSAGDPQLRACLVRTARAVAFEAPDPPGFVDVQLPLVLAPRDSERQRPLCE